MRVEKYMGREREQEKVAGGGVLESPSARILADDEEVFPPSQARHPEIDKEDSPTGRAPLTTHTRATFPLSQNLHRPKVPRSFANLYVYVI